MTPRPRTPGGGDADTPSPSRPHGPNTGGTSQNVAAVQNTVGDAILRGRPGAGTQPAGVPAGGPSGGLAGGEGGPGGVRPLPGGTSDAGPAPIREAGVPPRDGAVPAGDRPVTGDPVDIATGEVVMSQADVRLAGVLPLVLSRTHVSSYRVGRWFGPSWASTLDQRLEVDGEGVWFASADGMLLRYPLPGSDGKPVWPVEGPRLSLAATMYGYEISDRAQGYVWHFQRPGDEIRAGVRAWPLTTIGDRNGNRIDLEYDQAGWLTGVRHNGGYHIGVETTGARITALSLDDRELVRYRYDASRQLTEVYNSSGQPLVFDYDTDGRMLSWTDRIGNWYRYDYDASGRCARTTGAERALECRLAYDLATRTTSVTDSLGHTRRYVLNEARRVVQEIDPLGRVTTQQWDRDRLLTRTDPLGRVTRYTYNDEDNLIQITRPDGSKIALAYNEVRQPTSVTGADQTVRRFEYDPGGNLTAAIDEVGAVSRYGYQRYGRLASFTDPTGASFRMVTNQAGLPTEVTDPTGATIRYQRDQFGRPARITDPVGGTTMLDWTVEGRPTWRRLPDGVTERWRYDAEGNLVEHVDAMGAATRYEIGPFGLVTARTGPDGTRLEFEYDTELRLIAVTNPQGLVWRYEYDPAGQLVAETDFNEHTIRYEYDPAGQLVARTNGSGQSMYMRYDVLGNVVEQRSDEGELTSFGYDAAGRRTYARNGDAEVTFGLDAVGRVVAETCNGATVVSAYDLAGRRVHRRTPSGAEATWTYDGRGLPVALRTAGHTLSFTHDAAGRETARRLDTAVDLIQAWDANHRMIAQSLTTATSGTPDVVGQRQWSYRPDGRLIEVEDDHGSQRFDLDAAGRVAAVHGRNWTERYAYDTAGNMTDAAWPCSDSAAEMLSADNRGIREYAGTLIIRAGQVRYEHDDCGRVTLRQRKRLSGKPLTWRYTWNAEERLTSVTTPDGTVWRYRYDPLGRRIAKQRLDDTGAVVERVDFCWDGSVMAEQTRCGSDASTITTVWDWAPGYFRPLVQSERTTLRDAPQELIDQRFYAIVTDMVATPTELVDVGGEIVWRRRQTLWGATAGVTGAVDCPLRFPGQYYDAETGDHYNFHRYYDPTTARYHTADPLGLAATPNPHTYVRNPHIQVDPLGLEPGDGSRLTQQEEAILRESRGVYHSPDFDQIRAAHAAGADATVNINGVQIQYVPNLPGSGFSNRPYGFAIGPEAFTSEVELKKTVLHEMYRIRVDRIGSSGGVSAEVARQETVEAFDFAERAHERMCT